MFKADAAKIRSLIFAKKMTLAELSLKTGLHAAICRRLATGQKVSLKTIAIAADFFNVSGEELLTAQLKGSD